MRPQPRRAPGPVVALLVVGGQLSGCGLALDYGSAPSEVTAELRLFQANTDLEAFEVELDGAPIGLRTPGTRNRATPFVGLVLREGQLGRPLRLRLVDVGTGQEIVRAGRPVRYPVTGTPTRPTLLYLWRDARGDLVLDHAPDTRGGLDFPNANVRLRVVHLDPRFPSFGAYALDGSSRVAVAVVGTGTASPASEFPARYTRWGLDLDPAVNVGPDVTATFEAFTPGTVINGIVTEVPGDPLPRAFLLEDGGDAPEYPVVPIDG